MLCCLTFPGTEPQDRPQRRSCPLVSHVAAPLGVSSASAIRRGRRRVLVPRCEGPHLSRWTCGGPYGLWPNGRSSSVKIWVHSQNVRSQLYKANEKLYACLRKVCCIELWMGNFCTSWYCSILKFKYLFAYRKNAMLSTHSLSLPNICHSVQVHRNFSLTLYCEEGHKCERSCITVL